MVASNPNYSLSAWQDSVAGVDRVLAQQLAENSNPYAVVTGLCLPAPKYVVAGSIAQYETAPDVILEPLTTQGIANFYVGARATTPGLSNVRTEEPISANAIPDFLQSHVGLENYSRYNLRIAEFLAGLAVVVISDRDGTITMDIAEGTLPPLTGGTKSPDFRASNNNPQSKLQYFGKDERGDWSDKPLPAEDETSLLNTPVRTAIWSAMKNMQRVPPGYFEFAVVIHHGQRLSIFADALLNIGNRNRAFSLPSSWSR